MILYKYVAYETGQSVVSNNTMSFTLPKYFNDPFELSAAYAPLTSLEEGEGLLEKAKIGWNNFKTKLSKFVSDQSYGILSLTRSALNPLMWAHYTEDHKGFVIGINVDDEIFTSTEMNRIPVQYGSIIYTESRPTAEILSQAEDEEQRVGRHEFDSHQLEFYQRLFLHKPMYWGYEEEVRVVKHILKAGEDTCPSGNFVVKDIGGKKLYLLALPPGAIEEIYLGLRNPLLKSAEALGKFKSAAKRYASPNLRIYRCEMGDTTWALDRKEL